MAEVVAELEGPVAAEPQAEEETSTAVRALLAGFVVVQLAWVAALLLAVVALIR